MADYRSTQIYVSLHVKRLCRAIGQSREITADQAADELLREAIDLKYPQAKEFVKKLEQIEKELIKSLSTK